MNDTVKIADLGIQINFPSWEKFNLDDLTNDHVVLFQYLVFHCRSTGEWTHSDPAIEKELGIREQRLKTVRNYFINSGILKTRIVRNSSNNRVTSYRLNFAELATPEKLKLFYREKTPTGKGIDLNRLADQYGIIAKQLAKLSTTESPLENSENQQGAEQKGAKALAKILEELYIKQRNWYNTCHTELRTKVKGMVKFSPAQVQNLEEAMRHFEDDEFIHNAFHAYAYTAIHVILGNEHELLPQKPRDVISYFLRNLKNNSEGVANNFDVIYRFGNYAVTHFRHGVKDSHADLISEKSDISQPDPNQSATIYKAPDFSNDYVM
ncbi:MULTISPECIES: hypothetical protein [Larkinella]|uniref:Uncharacterized protein n=1 Tax=Larkinella humicola TaxID=2607654 RepID=A0A5N1JK82_9BACT|nr:MULTISPECIES: hypothetical protein [Larkinella]KAA9356870.1 hypothetical protein F0P93_03775 [Larkinella humicola]